MSNQQGMVYAASVKRQAPRVAGSNQRLVAEVLLPKRRSARLPCLRLAWMLRREKQRTEHDRRVYAHRAPVCQLSKGGHDDVHSHRYNQ